MVVKPLNGDKHSMSEYPLTSPELATPGDVIEGYLAHFGISQEDLAKRIGLPIKIVNELIAGEGTLTPAIALKLETVLGRPAHFWNNLESNYQDKKERKKTAEEE
jgi:addiction module HigA family antidote